MYMCSSSTLLLCPFCLFFLVFCVFYFIFYVFVLIDFVLCLLSNVVDVSALSSLDCPVQFSVTFMKNSTNMLFVYFQGSTNSFILQTYLLIYNKNKFIVILLFHLYSNKQTYQIYMALVFTRRKLDFVF
jgi:hypothetical protein